MLHPSLLCEYYSVSHATLLCDVTRLMHLSDAPYTLHDTSIRYVLWNQNQIRTVQNNRFNLLCIPWHTKPTIFMSYGGGT